MQKEKISRDDIQKYRSLLTTYCEAIDRMWDKHNEKGTSWKEVSIGYLLEDVYRDLTEFRDSKTITPRIYNLALDIANRMIMIANKLGENLEWGE